MLGRRRSIRELIRSIDSRLVVRDSQTEGTIHDSWMRPSSVTVDACLCSSRCDHSPLRAKLTYVFISAYLFCQLLDLPHLSQQLSDADSRLVSCHLVRMSAIGVQSRCLQSLHPPPTPHLRSENTSDRTGASTQ